jgi:deoxycytidine triphosphate deaminase
MEPVHGKDIAPRVSGMISPKHQVHGFTVDLTVKNISSVDPTGRVDFGGSEYSPAGKLPIAAQRRNLEDKYHWWDLGRGSYFVEFNETIDLPADEFGYLEPDDRLIRAGATHAPFYLRGRVAPIETLLTVDTVRLQVKQNARIARIRVFRAATALSAPAAPAKPAAKPPRKKK